MKFDILPFKCIDDKLLIQIFLFQNRELQIMRKLEHCNIVKLKYFFYSSGDKVSRFSIIITSPVLYIHIKKIIVFRKSFSFHEIFVFFKTIFIGFPATSLMFLF